MAHVFVGDLQLVDTEVLAQLRQLPDTYWIFAEFSVGRNVDWLIIRPIEGQPATMILTELKRSSRPMRGGANGSWQRLDEAGAWTPAPSNGKDLNPYLQAVHTGNALQKWLFTNQARFRGAGDARPINEFKPWPEVLVLSPADVQHSMAKRPETGFGYVFQDLQAWYTHLLSWRQQVGVELSVSDVEVLAEVLGLAPLSAAQQPPELQPSAEQPSRAALLALMQALETRLEQVEDNLQILRTTMSASSTSPAAEAGAQPVLAVFPPDPHGFSSMQVVAGGASAAETQDRHGRWNTAFFQHLAALAGRIGSWRAQPYGESIEPLQVAIWLTLLRS